MTQADSGDAPPPRRPALALVHGALGDTVLLEPALRALAATGDLTVWGPAADRLWPLRLPRGPALETAAWPREALPLWGIADLPPALAAKLSAFGRVVTFSGPGPLSDRVRALGGLAIAPARAFDPDLAAEDTHAATLPLVRLLAATGLPAPVDPRPRLSATAEDRGRGRALAGADAYVVVHPGSGGRDKRWPPARVAAALDAAREDLPAVVVVLGPVELDQGDDAAELASGRTVIRAPSMQDLVALLAGARAMLGNDSGPTHLAAALGTPTLAVFGPTDPRAWSTATITLRGEGRSLEDPTLVRRAAEALIDLAAR